MKVLLSIILFTLTTITYAGVSFKDAKALYSHLENKTGFHVPLYLDNRTMVNAYTTPHAIYVTQGMLDFVKSPEELIWVLAHEQTHWAYQDTRQPESSTQELRADKQGYRWCQSLGYKKCKTFLVRAQTAFGNKGNDIHPDWSIRIKNLNRG